jgi:hypothetical protein
VREARRLRLDGLLEERRPEGVQLQVDLVVAAQEREAGLVQLGEERAPGIGAPGLVDDPRQPSRAASSSSDSSNRSTRPTTAKRRARFSFASSSIRAASPFNGSSRSLSIRVWRLSAIMPPSLSACSSEGAWTASAGRPRRFWT